jgi:hypothetical protein
MVNFTNILNFSASGLPIKALHILFVFSLLHFSSIRCLFEGYKSCSSSLCKFVYSRLTATSLELNNLFNILFPHSLSSSSFHGVTEQLLHSY